MYICDSQFKGFKLQFYEFYIFSIRKVYRFTIRNISTILFNMKTVFWARLCIKEDLLKGSDTPLKLIPVRIDLLSYQNIAITVLFTLQKSYFTVKFM